MTRQETFEMMRARRGGIRCHRCDLKLNRNNLEYTEKAYPSGTVELVPACKSCSGNNQEGET